MAELITPGTAGWTWNGNAGANSICETDGALGSCLQVGGNGVAHSGGPDDGGWYHFVTGITAGKVYNISAWVKAYSPTYRNTTAKINFEVSATDVNNNRLRLINQKLVSDLTTFDWIHIPIVQYKAVSGDIKIKLMFGMKPSTDVNAYIRIDQMSCYEIDAETITTDHVSVSAAGYTAWTSPYHADTKSTTTAPAQTIAAVALKGAKGETLPFQLAVRPTALWSNGKVAFSNLTSGGNTIASSNCSFRLGHMLCCDKLTGNITNMPYSRDGLSIEPLVTGTSFPLAANTTFPFMIEVKIPTDAVAGDYTGTLTFKDDTTTKFTIDMTLTVFDFALPTGEDRDFLVNARLNPPSEMPSETLDATTLGKYLDDIYTVLHGQSDLYSFTKAYDTEAKTHTITGALFWDLVAYMGTKGYTLPEIRPTEYTVSGTLGTFTADTTHVYNMFNNIPWVIDDTTTDYEESYASFVKAIKDGFEDRSLSPSIIQQFGDEIDPTDNASGSTTTGVNQYTKDMKVGMPKAKCYYVGKPGDSDEKWNRSHHMNNLVLNAVTDLPWYKKATEDRFGTYNVGYYHNNFWSQAYSLHRHLWLWTMLPLALWFDGYRAGFHLWETKSWTYWDPWDDGATHNDSNYVLPGANQHINFFYPPNETLGYTSTPTRSIRLQALGYGVGLVFYAEKLQKIINSCRGTLAQRATAQSDLNGLKTTLSLHAPTGLDQKYDHFALHLYSELDTWRDTVAGHIELLQDADVPVAGSNRTYICIEI